MAKKNYNPFKMWGSYVGSLIGSFIGGTKYSLDGYKPSFSALPQGIEFYYLIFSLLIGFLIGWGIHSLFRSLKK